ncbi:MAG: hypothetical protein V8R08_03960 [Coriobacteriales bacterium]
MKPKFSFIITIDISMSLIVGAVMSVAMMLYNGQPLEPVPLLLNIVLATVIGVVVLLIIPVIKGGGAFARFYGSHDEGSLGFGLLQSVVIATVMTFCVSFGMTAVGTGFETFPDGTTFVMRWLIPIASIWGIAYVATILGLPLCMALARKVSGTPAGPPPAE